MRLPILRFLLFFATVLKMNSFPYALAPNVSASENLTEFNLLGITASGSHGEAGLFCFFPMVLPFTVFNMGPSAIEQVPIDSCAAVLQPKVLVLLPPPTKRLRPCQPLLDTADLYHSSLWR